MDKAGSQRDLPELDETTDRVAERRPEAVCTPTYGEIALKLLDNGYEPLPIQKGQKRPAVEAWTTVGIDAAQVEAWCQRFGSCGIGLRTGNLVAVDIDILDPELAHRAAEITRVRLGETLIRVGLWPKRLLLYRTLTPMSKLKLGKVEILGLGQQFVAFGIHPDARRQYDWPLGENPLDVPFDALPLVDELAIEALLVELQPIAGSAPSGSRRTVGAGPAGDVSRDSDGQVTDGRDKWLAIIAFHTLHDVLERGDALDEQVLAARVWQQFADSTDLGRPKQDGGDSWALRDALRKLRDKLRLHRDGKLPDRQRATVEADYTPPTQDATSARQELNRVLGHAMAAVSAWHREGRLAEPPRMGLRATTGLGKSTAARRHIAELVADLAKDGMPGRLLNFVPSLSLADETAAAWAELGFRVAVLRGYEALHPVTRDPMCRDIPAVRAAVNAGLDIQSSACFRSQKQRCPHFVTCAKQNNRRAVQEAQIVVAAYDALFTGFAGDTEDFALILIDEACWPRCLEAVQDLTIEALPLLGIAAVGPSRRQDARGADLADVVGARQRLSGALAALPAGEVTMEALTTCGIDAAICREAVGCEQDALPEVHLSPGQGSSERKLALERSKMRALGLQVIGLWLALADLLDGRPAARAKVWLGGMDKSGQRPIHIFTRKAMAAELARLPLLHLDATLRPDLAQVILPGLEVSTVEAQAPHQQVRLISGSFGKSNLCPDPRGGTAETQRRENRLKETVDYVRWHALRQQGGRVLVITYKAIEATFAEIPGVETAHYNAVAGLDGWGDVACLFLIGRPLPASDELRAITGALFDHSATGDYAAVDVGVVIGGGKSTAIRAMRHPDPPAETLRAAICDDEVMQALGRGRGVNRTADNPLEVHLMADVVLPIAYDRVVAWETVCPDIVQRMLLNGLAVDSPADAVALHPGLFETVVAADHAFRQVGFNRHFPIRDTYREMAVKSAAYRRPGRGRGWQRAWWIDRSENRIRACLEAILGPLAEWSPDDLP